MQHLEPNPPRQAAFVVIGRDAQQNVTFITEGVPDFQHASGLLAVLRRMVPLLALTLEVETRHIRGLRQQIWNKCGVIVKTLPTQVSVEYAWKSTGGAT